MVRNITLLPDLLAGILHHLNGQPTTPLPVLRRGKAPACRQQWLTIEVLQCTVNPVPPRVAVPWLFMPHKWTRRGLPICTVNPRLIPPTKFKTPLHG
jgi:hypothetical protein